MGGGEGQAKHGIISIFWIRLPQNVEDLDNFFNTGHATNANATSTPIFDHHQSIFTIMNISKAKLFCYYGRSIRNGWLFFFI